jgi:YidC/Oxa1 family membrane protein insertase
MANQRILLWAALAAVLWLNYQAWQNDYAPKPAATSPAAPTATTPGTPAPTGLENAVPKAVAPAQTEGAPSAASPVPQAPPSVPTHEASDGAVVRVVTDVLDLDISTKGGTLTRADLLKYPRHKKQAELVRLFDDTPGKPIYVLQSGLTASGDAAAPNHLTTFESQAREYRLSEGSNELRVPLTWTDGKGLSITKTYIVQRGSYRVRVEYAIANAGGTAYRPASYVQFLKQQPKTERSMFNVESYAFVGPAIYDGTKYRKLDIDDDEDRVFEASVTDGWLAGLQHHFVAAAVPAAKQPYQYRLQVHDRQFLLSAVGPTQTVDPGAKATLTETLFVGPKL